MRMASGSQWGAKPGVQWTPRTRLGRAIAPEHFCPLTQQRAIEFFTLFGQPLTADPQPTARVLTAPL